MSWFEGCSTLVLAFHCHPTFVYVRCEMVNPSLKRVRKSILYSLAAETIIYILMGVAGYLSTGDDLTPDLYIFRKNYLGGTDYLMQSVVYLFLYVGLIHIVLNLFPCREQAYAFFKIDHQDTKKHFLFTLLIMLCSHALIVVYPNIMSLFGIGGSIFCSLIGWIVPYTMQI
jgi:amino acid permease